MDTSCSIRPNVTYLVAYFKWTVPYTDLFGDTLPGITVLRDGHSLQASHPEATGWLPWCRQVTAVGERVETDGIQYWFLIRWE